MFGAGRCGMYWIAVYSPRVERRDRYVRYYDLHLQEVLMMVLDSRRLKQALLFLWGVFFAALVNRQVPETPANSFVSALVLWAAFYPFMTTTTVSVGRYWVMLAVMAPVVFVLSNVAGPAPDAFKIWAGVALLAVPVVAAILKRLRSRSSQKPA